MTDRYKFANGILALVKELRQLCENTARVCQRLFLLAGSLILPCQSVAMISIFGRR